MNLWPIKTVTAKELTDGFRDRRSLYTILAPMLFGPLVITLMLHQLSGVKKAAEEIRIAVNGRELAPVLVGWLQQQSGVEVVAGPIDAETAVRDGKEDVVLLINNEFSENFQQSKPAPVQLFCDSTRKSAQPKLTRLTSLLNAFNSEMASLRLIAHGVSPEAASPLKVQEVDVADSQQRAATILNVVLMFLVVTLITAGMQIATDSTAGERERGSLEALLLNPVPRWQLIMGKWLAAAVAAFAGMVGCLLVVSIVLTRLPLEELGIRFHLGSAKIVLLVAAMAPLALFVPAIQTYLSCSAKSFKEAQSYSVFLVIPVAFMGVVSMFYPVVSHPWIRAIPMLSQYALGMDILAGKVPSSQTFIWAAIEAAFLAGIFVWLAARRLSNERIVFGN